MIFEIGTGKMRHQLALDFVVSPGCCKWSPDGRNLATGSSVDRQSKIFAVDQNSTECIWSVIDAMRFDSDFWKNYPVDLLAVTMENVKVRQ